MRPLGHTDTPAAEKHAAAFWKIAPGKVAKNAGSIAIIESGRKSA